MSKKKNTQQGIGVENVDEALSRTEQFIENNQKLLTRVLLVIVVVVVGLIVFKRHINQKSEEAEAYMFHAELYLQRDSFELALNELGTSSYYGFYDILDEYKFTKAANRAKYGAGLCHLHLGNYEEAIDYLKSFRPRNIKSSAFTYGALGEAYCELEEYEEAVSYYLKAANKINNSTSTPTYLMEAANIYKELEEFEKELELYKRIEKEFPKSTQARDIEKYITRAELNLGM